MSVSLFPSLSLFAERTFIELPNAFNIILLFYVFSAPVKPQPYMLFFNSSIHSNQDFMYADNM